MNSQSTSATIKDEFTELVVGGITYTVTAADVQKYPESFFAALLKKEWKPSDNTPITIDRDGGIFKYIFGFLVVGQLPRRPDGTISLDAPTLNAVREEADFYNLPALVKECDTNVAPTDFMTKLAAYSTIRSYVNIMKRLPYSRDAIPKLSCVYASEDPTALVNVLASTWSPFCALGKFPYNKETLFYYATGNNVPIYKSSTMTAPNVPELLAEAQQSAFGRGTETVVDTTVRKSHEIPASKLNAEALAKISKSIDLHQFSLQMKLEVRPYKLVIYQEGGHFDQHRDTVRGDNHIGTLVVILNSEYTGGELQISHAGRTVEVTGPYSWVAMYGDCLHKINAVTSGTRVSLIYDLYVAAGAANDANDDNDDDGDDYDVDESEGELAQFIGKKRSEKDISADMVRTIDASHQQLIFDAVDCELADSDTVVICLAHKYPTCQSTPYFLKGGDLALYELLRDRYDVSVEPVSVLTTFDRNERDGYMSAAMIKDVEARAAGHSPAEQASKNRSITKFVIPSNLNADSVLDYSPFIDHTGNESQQEKTVYVVAGLQVRKR